MIVSLPNELTVIEIDRGTCSAAAIRPFGQAIVLDECAVLATRAILEYNQSILTTASENDCASSSAAHNFSFATSFYSAGSSLQPRVNRIAQKFPLNEYSLWMKRELFGWILVSKS